MSKKQNAKKKAFEAAREESFKRSENRCLICGENATEGHHFIFRSQGGENVAENIIPLCNCHHTGKEGIHSGVITHMDIYRKAELKRPDIHRYAKKNIKAWIRRAETDLIDQLL